MKHTSVPRFALLGVLVLSLIAAPVFAHPPTSIVLRYDSTAGILTATITHEVANPSTHDIDEVRIMVNNAIITDIHDASQPNNTVFTYTYPIQAAAGSTISLWAECNLGGERTQTLLAGGATQPATPTMTTTTMTMTPTKTMTTAGTTPAPAATTPPTTVPSTTAQFPALLTEGVSWKLPGAVSSSCVVSTPGLTMSFGPAIVPGLPFFSSLFLQ
ncbi:MAG: hypothetical protein LUQ13_02275 [Methanomicrobiales archaeon]|nr:hypothetical protein [Methanomicrobiales archaeon]